MALDLSTFTGAINNVNSFTSALGQYVLQPLQQFGIAGFVFDIEGEARVELNSEITDHYIENNSAVQDHIGVKPKRVTLRNYIGELVYTQSPQQNPVLTQAVQKLTELTALAPTLTAQAIQAQNLIAQQMATTSISGTQFAADVNATANLYSLAKNLLSAQGNKQQAAYQYFKALQQQKTMFSIQTPFEFMTNMAIESVIMIQPEESVYTSSLSITLKEIRTASTKNISTGNNAGSGSNATTGSSTNPNPSFASAGSAVSTNSGFNGNYNDYAAKALQQLPPIVNQGSTNPAPIPNLTIPDITNIVKVNAAGVIKYNPPPLSFTLGQ